MQDPTFIIFFLLNVNFIERQRNKVQGIKSDYKARRSLVQASLAEGGRDWKQQQLNGKQSEGTALAKTWAKWFASRLTQLKKHKENLQANSNDCPVTERIFQGHSSI